VSAAAWSVDTLSGAVSRVATTYRDLTAREQAHHVLNRLAFGPRPGEVDRVVAMGVDRWIEQQLRPEALPDREVDRVVATAFPAVRQSAADLLREHPPREVQRLQNRLRSDSMMTRADSIELRREAQRNREFVTDLLSSKVARAVVSERQLAEVMTDFWENHFNVFIGKGQLRYYLPEYREATIRPHALGRFRDLLGAVAKSPAMLLYLDNAQSVADSGQPTLGGGPAALGRGRGRAAVNRRIQRMDSAQRAILEQAQARRPRGLNENYARELLELHTLGVDGGYTQKDVIEVARALTGWSVNQPRAGTGFAFRALAHDAGPKVVLGHALKAGRGIEDGEEVLDIVSRHPSTAMFISRKLVVRFVSDDPPDDLVERAAATFRRTNGDIREVVRTIVTSNEFFARSAYRSKVKSPFEVTVSALRALGARADTTPFSANLVGRLGQPLYGHQAPNGWPETGAAWINTGAILNRINLGIVVAAGRVPGAPLRAWPGFTELVNTPRTQQVDAVIESFLAGRASPETREILASGNNPLMDRASADTTMVDAGAGVEPMGRGPGALPGRGRQGGGFQRLPQLTGLPQVIGLALGSPEFQRR
jgi:uncharacterized protein (DUF1800 family)